ncbi:MAG TPA: hypothetical protein VMV46_09815 [Thermoanaerobaculia bacterium]|nr:hypothetical protein [Thermoanaerobaculia bacterium]
MVFADPVTGTIAANGPVPDAPRPRALGFANAAVEWGGERWATFVWSMTPERERQERIAELRARFVDGPVLVHGRGRNTWFVRTGVTPIPGAGTIYPGFRVAGEGDVAWRARRGRHRFSPIANGSHESCACLLRRAIPTWS